MWGLSVTAMVAWFSVAALICACVGGVFVLRKRLHDPLADKAVTQLTSAAGAIDAAARSLKIMLGAVPGSTALPEDEVAAVVEFTATAMLSVVHTLPTRVLASEQAISEMRADLQELRQQLLGLSKRPTV